MKKLIPKLFLLLLIGGIAFSTGGCKSKKKLAEEAAAKEYAVKVESAKAELQAILDDNGAMPLSEKKRRLNDIKAQNLNDPDVNALIVKVEEKIQQEINALKELEEEARRLEEAEISEKSRFAYIDDYFYEIANAASVEEANTRIEEALKIYTSPDAPVLIIISQADGVTDYDKPTTIKDYLNYLKDQKKYTNEIYNVEFDDYDQITVIELLKK